MVWLDGVQAVEFEVALQKSAGPGEGNDCFKIEAKTSAQTMASLKLQSAIND